MPEVAPGGSGSRRGLAPARPVHRGRAGERVSAPVEQNAPLAGAGAVVLAALVAAAAYAGPLYVAGVLAIAAALLVIGWPALLSLPSPRGAMAATALGSAALLGAVVSTGTPPSLRRVPDALAVGVIAVFVHQLARRDGRPRLALCASGSCLGLLMVAASVALVPLPALVDGRYALLAAMAAVAASSLVDMVGAAPSLRPWRVPVALVLGALVGAYAGHLGYLHWQPFGLLGLGCAAVTQALRRVFGVLPRRSGARPQAAAAAAPVLLVGILAYAVSRVFVS